MIFLKSYQLLEASASHATSDARVAANQNLPGSAVVGQTVFVGVSHRLRKTLRHSVSAFCLLSDKISPVIKIK